MIAVEDTEQALMSLIPKLGEKYEDFKNVNLSVGWGVIEAVAHHQNQQATPDLPRLDVSVITFSVDDNKRLAKGSTTINFTFYDSIQNTPEQFRQNYALVWEVISQIKKDNLTEAGSPVSKINNWSIERQLMTYARSVTWSLSLELYEYLLQDC